MVNLAEKHDDISDAQLADAEISRILSALKKAEFKRSESANARPNQIFKPRSLMEIAETTQHQSEVEKAAETLAPANMPEDIEDHSDQINRDGNRQSNDLAIKTQKADVSAHVSALSTGEAADDANGNVDQVGVVRPDPISLDAPQSHSEAQSNDGVLKVTGTSIGDSTTYENENSDDADNGASISPFETAQAAYDRGHQDGISVGREAAETDLRTSIEAELEAKLADKIDIFERALTALSKPQTSNINSLSESLQAAVVKLAAARTGMAIDELPELMVTRIENLADAVGKNVAAGQVFLHPDDHLVVAPIMAARQDPVMIEVDPQLYRGDIRIKFDGIDISDVAELRTDWQASPQMTHENFASTKSAENENSESEFTEQTPVDVDEYLQAPSVQSNLTASSTTDGENSERMADSSDENQGASSLETAGLMPLTTTGGEGLVPNEGTDENQGASSSEPIGLMPLTTTSGEGLVPNEGTDENQGASSLETAGLMPLTTKGGEGLVPNEGTDENNGTSSSEPIGLMPLTSKDVDE